MFFLKFLSHGILRGINERDVFLNCKHKHMLKNGAPPDKWRDLLLLKFHGFSSTIDSIYYHIS